MAEQQAKQSAVEETAKRIEVLTHSSIRITGENTIYIDPFHVEQEFHDADYILITHEHYDHFSMEDIAKVLSPQTILVMPETMRAQAAGISGHEILFITPGGRLSLAGLTLEAAAAYNLDKPFHPKENGWVGYILEIDGVRIFIAGDTDMTPDNRTVSCDVALLPIGGKYTTDAAQAAEFANVLRPRIVIPTHYGSVTGGKENEAVFAAGVDSQIRVDIKMQKY